MKKVTVILLLVIAIMGCEKKAEETSTPVYVEVDDYKAMSETGSWDIGVNVDEMTDIESRKIYVTDKAQVSSLCADFDGNTKKITWTLTNAFPDEQHLIQVRVDGRKAFEVKTSLIYGGTRIDEEFSKRLIGAKKVLIRASKALYEEKLTLSFDVDGFDLAWAWLNTAK